MAKKAPEPDKKIIKMMLYCTEHKAKIILEKRSGDVVGYYTAGPKAQVHDLRFQPHLTRASEQGWFRADTQGDRTTYTVTPEGEQVADRFGWRFFSGAEEPASRRKPAPRPVSPRRSAAPATPAPVPPPPPPVKPAPAPAPAPVPAPPSARPAVKPAATPAPAPPPVAAPTADTPPAEPLVLLRPIRGKVGMLCSVNRILKTKVYINEVIAPAGEKVEAVVRDQHSKQPWVPASIVVSTTITRDQYRQLETIHRQAAEEIDTVANRTAATRRRLQNELNKLEQDSRREMEEIQHRRDTTIAAITGTIPELVK